MSIDVVTREKPTIQREVTSIKMNPLVWKETKVRAIRDDTDVSSYVEDALLEHLGVSINDLIAAEEERKSKGEKKH